MEKKEIFKKEAFETIKLIMGKKRTFVRNQTFSNEDINLEKI